tara:strand:+ start:68 stop:310 length:243 start_codon:yes stop_codon:yes gene_type:complete
MTTSTAWKKRVKDETGKYFIHIKTNSVYTIEGYCIIEANWSIGVMYKGLESNTMIVRPAEEFFDGRFTAVTNTTTRTVTP